MQRLVLSMIVLLVLTRSAFSQGGPDPITVSHLTQTSAEVTWTRVQNATSYTLWDQCTDGTYGFQWCEFATVTGTSYNFSGLEPGTAVNLCIGANGNVCGPPGSSGTTFFQTYQRPWIDPISPTTYTVNCGWTAILTYGGVPAPSISLVHAPSGMWLDWAFGGVLSGAILWKAQSTAGVTFTLELVNSQGTKFKTTTLTPNRNIPCSPPVLPPRVVESWLGNTSFQWAVQGVHPITGYSLFVRRPGSTCWCPDSSSRLIVVRPGVYRTTFKDMTTKGAYGVQARFMNSNYKPYSNPIVITVP